MPAYIDMTGKRYNKLTAIKRMENLKSGQTMWLFKCDCGKQIIASGYAVRSGHTKSCGCLLSKTTASLKYSHGMARSRIYRIYQKMKSRCYSASDKSYKRYGKRGICVCPEWESDFQNFYDWSMENGYSDDLTIDRIDNDGNYEPSNCRWTDATVQANNRRNNRKVTYNGETKTISEWSRETKVPEATIRARLNNGVNVKFALFSPTRRMIENNNKA